MSRDCKRVGPPPKIRAAGIWLAGTIKIRLLFCDPFRIYLANLRKLENTRYGSPSGCRWLCQDPQARQIEMLPEILPRE
jgi:hypothetical protein